MTVSSQTLEDLRILAYYHKYWCLPSDNPEWCQRLNSNWKWTWKTVATLAANSFRKHHFKTLLWIYRHHIPSSMVLPLDSFDLAPMIQNPEFSDDDIIFIITRIITVKRYKNECLNHMKESCKNNRTSLVKWYFEQKVRSWQFGLSLNILEDMKVITTDGNIEMMNSCVEYWGAEHIRKNFLEYGYRDILTVNSIDMLQKLEQLQLPKRSINLIKSVALSHDEQFVNHLFTILPPKLINNILLDNVVSHKNIYAIKCVLARLVNPSISLKTLVTFGDSRILPLIKKFNIKITDTHCTLNIYTVSQISDVSFVEHIVEEYKIDFEGNSFRYIYSFNIDMVKFIYDRFPKCIPYIFRNVIRSSDISFEEIEMFSQITENHYYYIFGQLLCNPHITNNIEQFKLIYGKYKEYVNHAEVQQNINPLILDQIIIPDTCFGSAYIWFAIALKHNRYDLVNKIIKNNPIRHPIQFLRESIYSTFHNYDELSVIKILTYFREHHPNADPDFDNNVVIKRAYHCEYWELLDYMLTHTNSITQVSKSLQRKIRKKQAMFDKVLF
jgi:hypothetical protein